MLPPRPLWAAGAFCLASLATWAILQRPAPLLVNLGAGDEAFARGFRDAWERDGLQQSGETMFRWTRDGARLELPIEVREGRPRARLRLARFLDTTAEITLATRTRVVDHWSQRPRGWRVRTVELGSEPGPLSLQFRSWAPDDVGLGLALDWVEIGGVERLTPFPEVWAGLGMLILGVPGLLAPVLGIEAAVWLSTGLMALTGLAIHIDRLGGLLAAAGAGAPGLVAVAVLIAVFWMLRRAWGPLLAGGRGALMLAVAGTLVSLVLMCHPGYYYPDVDTHAGYLDAIRQDPGLLFDSTEYQLRAGVFFQKIGGQRIAFPYSAFFHSISWPLAPLLGTTPALKTWAAASLGLAALVTHALARGVGLAAGPAWLAQALFLLIPVTASDVTLARYPAMLGQALELLLLVHLVQIFPKFPAGRKAAATFALLILAQAAYTGSLLTVVAFVGIFGIWELVAGDRRGARRLLVACALASALVVAVRYGSFFPVVARRILPFLGLPQDQAPIPQSPTEWLLLATRRLSVFFDLVYPALLLPGLMALRSAPRHARRLVVAVIAAGLGLLVLRLHFPALFRHVKEVQLLAGPVAVLAAAGLAWLAGRGWAGRGLAAAAVAVASGWGLERAVDLYSAHFWAVGR